MRIYKPTYKNEKGKLKEIRKFYVEVVDKREKKLRKVLRFSAYESQGLSKKLGGKIQDLINHATMNDLNPDLIDWFQNYAPIIVQERLIGIGLLPKREEEVLKPLLDYLPEFQKDIYQESQKSRLKKETTKDTQARTTTARVRKLIEGCGFITWQDVSAEKVNDHIESRPDNIWDLF